MRRRPRRSRSGFSLLEAIVALLLASILFGGISLYTGSWLQRWQDLIASGSRTDMAAIILDRLVEDLEAAQPFAKDDKGTAVLFEGGVNTITFLRPALGFNARAGIDRVTYLRTNVGGDQAIVRSRRDHGDQRSGGEDLPLIRGPIKLAFTYTAANGETYGEWHNRSTLPGLINVEISGTEPRPWKEFAVARLRVDMPANCGTTEAFQACMERFAEPR